MKFIHCADIHLDSPLLGLEAYDGAPVGEIRGATRKAFERLIQQAVIEQVAFVLIAGDLYDGDQPDYHTALFFNRQMAVLRDANIPVYVVKGNHDAANKITKTLKPPKNVHIFREDAASTEFVPGLNVAIHGQSFATQDVSEDLAANYSAAIPGKLNIGLLHTCLAGTEGYLPYAPTNVNVLHSKGYDYWALGHVHCRTIVCRDPWVVFPGNLQGRHARETGEKTFEIVKFEDDRILGIEPQSVAPVLWHHLRVDASMASNRDAVLEQIEDAFRRMIADEDRLCCTRVEVMGMSRAHASIAADQVRFQNDVRACALDVAADQIWVERVKLGTTPAIELEQLLLRNDPLAEVLRQFTAAHDDAGLQQQISSSLSDLEQKLALFPELAAGVEARKVTAPDYLTKMLQEAQSDFLARVLPAEEL
jgi:DNA repair exonuclease SbcCD nuclease subunit